MRIVSLLPSLTELVCALGRRVDLVGVTHECDYPVGVEQLPHLTRSRITPSTSSAAIDAAVVEQGGSLYDLDGALLAELRPDLILTQEQCDVCAVNEATVRRVAAGIPSSPRVESVNPTCLADLDAMFRRVGVLLDAKDAAESLIARFDATVTAIAHRRRGRPLRRVLILEWFDPPFSSGHWNPEIVSLAGGAEVIGEAGQRSRRLSWREVAEADPELIILAPCGFTIERTEQELAQLQARPEWTRLGAVRSGSVILVDGSAYFSRPGPRLELSLKIAAAAIDPEACGDLAPVEGWRRLSAL
ncbi:cobalamin-binding protein [Singulisphaera sp. Ch08]|uniref:Cobalamin-binding protein n=1 Tax=Singulisphaera sp. Ch08 TaxID=3120278 RepID=A0AAU7CHL9_9BACT